MTGTVRDSRRAATRLLSMWSDNALDEVEREGRRSAAARRGRATSGAAARRGGAAAGRPSQASRAPASRPPSKAGSGRAGGAPAAGRPPQGSRRPAGGRTAGSRSPASRSRVSQSPDQERARSGDRASGRTGAGARSAAPARRRTTSRDPVDYGAVPTRSRSSRPGNGRSGNRRQGASGRRSRAGEEAPAAFRARRRSADSGRSGARGRTRRHHRPPVTQVGERNAAYLTLTVLGLTLFGLVMVLSASSVASLHQLADSPFYQFKRQLMWAGIGAFAFVVSSRVDYRRLRPLAGPLMVVTIVLLLALFVPGLGLNENGSTRWLGVGPLVLQPSELAKLVLVVFVADLLARRERRMDRPELTVRPVMLILSVLCGLIVVQPKLGTPIILAAVTILMLFIAGARMRSLTGWLLAAVLMVTVLAFVEPYRRDRLVAFLDPWKDPLGDGLQSIQSQVGIASGGLFGLGLGASRAKWGFLPFAHTDFIFAIVAEEVGLLGAGALIGGFLLISWFGLRAALAAPDRFGTLLAAGITSWLLVQAFLNIGMVLGVLPITGEALPFVSAGGSSLVVTLTAAGILTSVSRRARS